MNDNINFLSDIKSEIDYSVSCYHKESDLQIICTKDHTIRTFFGLDRDGNLEELDIIFQYSKYFIKLYSKKKDMVVTITAGFEDTTCMNDSNISFNLFDIELSKTVVDIEIGLTTENSDTIYSCFKNAKSAKFKLKGEIDNTKLLHFSIEDNSFYSTDSNVCNTVENGIYKQMGYPVCEVGIERVINEKYSIFEVTDFEYTLFINKETDYAIILGGNFKNIQYLEINNIKKGYVLSDNKGRVMIILDDDIYCCDGLDINNCYHASIPLQDADNGYIKLIKNNTSPRIEYIVGDTTYRFIKLQEVKTLLINADQETNDYIDIGEKINI